MRQFVDWGSSKTPQELASICLARIAERDSGLKAWVEVAPQFSDCAGPLTGIPYAAKDIYETRGLATEFGSPLYAGRKGQTDAALILMLRRLGATLLGKTTTTAFAYFDPAATRNPRDPERTPGGSSSGSAVAVAAGMAAFALGTQTQGSVLRPASFCGVVGFKPTFGLLPLDGVLPFAPSLDTAGLFTQTADDMQLLWGRMGFHPEERPIAPIVALAAFCPAGRVDSRMRGVFDSSLERLRFAGVSIESVEMLWLFEELLPAVRLMNDYEGARTHEARWKEHGAHIGEKLGQLVERGLAIPRRAYREALDVVARMKQEVAGVFQRYPIVATPAAPGEAPLGLGFTGDPSMNSPWTALGAPAISIPMPVGNAMPLGLQLTAAPGGDAMLLAWAARVESSLA